VLSSVSDNNFTTKEDCEESDDNDEVNNKAFTKEKTKGINKENTQDGDVNNSIAKEDDTPFDFESLMTPRKSNMKAEIIGLPSEVGDFTYAYCNELCKYIDNPKSMDFLRFRDVLYDMLIYDIKVTNVLWTVLRYITKKYTLTEETYDKLMIDMYTFLQYYNNNYRPIYHLESYLFKIINTVHYSSDILDSTKTQGF
tara:strand:- start:218 stop:808 length:591 start_codon:yes stop_codon:yes gene_type:complete